MSSYRVAVYRHLIPGLGAHRLNKLRPEHLESLYAAMLKTRTRRGSTMRPATVHQVHRTARTALNEAVRRGYAPSNPARLAKAPRVEELDVEPFTVDEVKAVLAAAGDRRNAARWAVALALGLRQGEALGLRWADVDLEAQTLTIRRSRVRPKYEHGCGGACGRFQAGYCPTRRQTTPEVSETKSRAGHRVVGLPSALCELLVQHHRQQSDEQERAGQLWQDGGWLFATELGAPINPRTDWSEWKTLLRSAGIRDSRLHDARHTAATVLLLLGVSERTIMGIMGWSNSAMTHRYAHMIDPIRREAARRVDDLIWSRTNGAPSS